MLGRYYTTALLLTVAVPALLLGGSMLLAKVPMRWGG
jgi:hypothetical protein